MLGRGDSLSPPGTMRTMRSARAYGDAPRQLHVESVTEHSETNPSLRELADGA